MNSKSEFSEKYNIWLLTTIQEKTAIRMQLFTQSEVAEITGSSLRTVQLFESYKSENLKLIYFYLALDLHNNRKTKL